MSFTPSKADPDVWMRRNADFYEYIAVYVYDLVIAVKDPKSIIGELVENTITSSRVLDTFHLGCDFN